VQTSRTRKSLSVEHTFSQDLVSLEDIQKNADQIFIELCERSKKLPPETRLHKRVVKIKFSDFSQTTLEETFPQAPHAKDDTWQDMAEYIRMLELAWKRSEKPVRLLGMGVRLVSPKSSSDLQQLDLFKP